MSDDWQQLCGALSCLKINQYKLDYEEINEKLKDLAKNFYNDDYTYNDEVLGDIRTLLKVYRRICIKNGFIKIGHLFHWKDTISITDEPIF